MDLDHLREQIDRIDREIVERLNDRVRLAGQIGHIKLNEGKAVYVPSREEEVFGKLTAHSAGPLPESALRAIWREIISAAIALERPLQIAYLGPQWTYTHQAAMKNFGSSLTYLDLATVPDVFDSVSRGEADYGVVPVENSTQGTVISTLDMLMEASLTVVAQIYLEINHSLISQSPVEEITAVHSKDNALGQCRQWLARRLPGVDLVDATSTAAAVELAKKTPGVAAIASKIAAHHYGVPVIEEGIQDKADNVTRFLVIGKTPTPRLGHGRDKSTFVFTLPNNHPGALIKALFPFSMRGINISKIESRPSRQKIWDYYFYIDVTGHREDPEVAQAIAELEQFCPPLKWLGSYPNTSL
ncbi:MAG: prephenate dehydratase [Opitutales bacterium]